MINRVRSQRILLVALALSLLLHLSVAPFLHWRQSSSQETERVSRARILRVQRAFRTPPPTPVPTPPPTPAPRRVVHVAHPVNLPVVRSSGGPPSVSAGSPVAVATRGTSKPTPTPTPVPRASATPCTGAPIPGQVLQAPSPPPIPPEARGNGTEGVAQIDVRLDAQAHVLGTSVRAGTGNAALDAIAEQMARDATYSPPQNECKSTAGIATFSVQFYLL